MSGEIMYVGNWGGGWNVGGDDDWEDFDEPVYGVGYDGQTYEIGRRRGRRRRQNRRDRRDERRDNRHGGGGGAPQLPAAAETFIPAPKPMLVQPAGAPMRHTLEPSGFRRQPLGLGSVVIPAATGPAAPGFAQAVVNVQREFQGQRLILSATENGPPSVPDALTGVALSQFLIASDNQLPSGTAQAAISYARDATDTEMELTPCTVGTIITLGFQNFLPNSVTLQGTLFGVTRR